MKHTLLDSPRLFYAELIPSRSGCRRVLVGRFEFSRVSFCFVCFGSDEVSFGASVSGVSTCPEVEGGGCVGVVSSRGLPLLALSARGAPSLMKAGLHRDQVCSSTIGRPDT